MPWDVSREDSTITADMADVQDEEWELLLASVEAELARSRAARLIIHAGTRPPDPEREALVETLSTIVRDQGVDVHVTYQ
jgi:hypothetical protein